MGLNPDFQDFIPVYGILMNLPVVARFIYPDIGRIGFFYFVGEGLVPSRIWAGINPAPTFYYRAHPAAGGMRCNNKLLRSKI